MKPSTTKAKARLDAALAAKAAAQDALAAARAAAADAEVAAQAADRDHRIHEAAAYLLAAPNRLARVRELVARGTAPGPAVALDRSMHDRFDIFAGIVSYEAPAKGRILNRTATAAPGRLAVAVLALIDAPEPSP
jgi:hypothetical protein